MLKASTNDSVSQFSAVTWTEQGQLQNNAWNISNLSYSLNQQAGFTYSRTVQENWSGSYAGSDSFSVNGNGQGSFTETGVGNYSNGSYSLSSYSLLGSSQGYSNLQENGSANGVAFGRGDTWYQIVNVHEVATVNAGVFSFSLYSTRQQLTETLTSTTGAYANDQQTNFLLTELDGTGQTGLQTTTAWSNYSFRGNSGNTVSSVSTMMVQLHGNLSLQQPENALMPMGAMATPITATTLQNANGVSLQAATLTVAAERTLSPQHRTTQHTLRMIVRRLHALDEGEGPQRRLAHPDYSTPTTPGMFPASPRSRFVHTGILGNQTASSCAKGEID
jgi:hypothetical protein